jgi:hypothetical protein
MLKFWIGNQPEPDDRRIIEVSDEDGAKVERAVCHKPFTVDVYDTILGEELTLADEDCGLGCRCALRVVEHFAHDVCPGCGNPSTPLEGVPDQSGRGCGQCGREWFEDLGLPAMKVSEVQP